MEIIVKVREFRIPFGAHDIADLAASYLNDRGVKV
jgi:hypothetical protein